MIKIDKLRSRFMKFMYGRYGADDLYKALFAMVLLLMIINLFLRSTVVSAFIVVLLVLVNYRVFSKNIYRRQKENTYYLEHTKTLRKELRLNVRRIKEFKTYRFRKCPSCKQVLRLKHVKGKHKTRCSKCGSEFSVNIII